MKATKGIDCVWGVDVSTKSIDVAILAKDGSWQTNAIAVSDATVPPANHARRLNLIRDRCLSTAAAVALERPESEPTRIGDTDRGTGCPTFLLSGLCACLVVVRARA
jgi:hypothetical protein